MQSVDLCSVRMGTAIRDAVAAGQTPIVVVTPGASAESVAWGVRQALESVGDVRTITVGRTGRSKADDANTSATETDSVSSGRLTLVVDGQWWPTDDANTALTDDDERLVVIRRSGIIPPWLTMVEAQAHRGGVRFEVEPLGVDELVAVGWQRGAATSAVEATEGWPDLLDAREIDPTMAHEAAVGLSMLDETARAAVELLVFGAITSDLGELLGIDGAELDTALASIETEGFVRRAAIPVALAAAVRAVTPPGRRSAAVQRVLERPVPGSVVAIAEALLSLDDRGELSMRVQLDASRELMLVDPSRARTFLDAAHRSGASASETAAIVGQMQILAGKPSDALQTLNDARDDPAAQLLVAAAWYALGDVAAAADALESSSIPELAPWARAGAGRPPAAAASTAEDPAASALTDAIGAWWAGDRDATADHLARAVLRSDASPLATWPTTPQAVATLVASRLGDLERAGHIAETAVADRAGGAPHRTSQLLLAAWCAARQGRLDDAAGVLDDLDHDALTPRQRWLWATVVCSLAVRDPEPGGLDDAVAEASAVLARWAVDLYDLELLGDLAAVMHRVGAGSIEDVLQPIAAVASRSECPADLEFDVAWVRLFATLSTDDFASMSAAAQLVLDRSAPRDEDPALARPSVIEQAVVGAASVLVACADGGVGADETIEAASALAASGRIHEAARLCGVAAMRTTDDAAARRLLKQSREWRVQRRRVKATKGVDRTVTRLSAQEERVAHLVDDGLTYKAIAAELFISPKTVEHHVAHVRAKLGASSRAELLRAIRSYFGEDGDSSPS